MVEGQLLQRGGVERCKVSHETRTSRTNAASSQPKIKNKFLLFTPRKCINLTRKYDVNPFIHVWVPFMHKIFWPANVSQIQERDIGEKKKCTIHTTLFYYIKYTYTMNILLLVQYEKVKMVEKGIALKIWLGRDGFENLPVKQLVSIFGDN